MKHETKKTLTPFEEAVMGVEDGTVKVPTVSSGSGTIPFFKYQMAVVKYQLGLMSKGLHFRGIKLKDIKQYYGLKGRTATDCIESFKPIFEKYTGTKWE